MSVATPPAARTSGHRQPPPITRSPVSAMITISNVAHPTHWARLSTVGR
jgi:hypothetical protein